MATTVSKDRLEVAILKAINEEIATIIDEEAKNASDRVYKRIKSKTADIAVRLFDVYSMERMGPDLVIRVKYEKE